MTTFSREGLITKLRSPRTASRVFGLDTPGQLVRAVPRMKFMFAVNFVLSPGGLQMMNYVDLNTYLDKGIMFKVKQIDKPKMNLVTADLNQYNKKRIVYTKVDYSEASMRLYDAVDNTVLRWWVDYFTYYYGDSRLKTAGEYLQSPVDPSFIDGTGWGFRPLIEDTNFFEKITVFAFYANTYTAFSYINPKITNVNWQQRDYSSNEPEEVDVSFKYELIEYEEFGKPIGDFSRFGWSDIDWLPVDSGPVKPVMPTVSQPRLFSNQTSNDYDGDIVIPPPSRQEFVTVKPGSAAPGAVPPTIRQQGSVFPGTTLMQFGDVESGTILRRSTTPIETRAVDPSLRSGLGRSVIQQGQLPVPIDASPTVQLYTEQGEQQLREAAERAGLVQPGSTEPISGRVVGGVVTSVTVNGQSTDLTGNLTPDQQIRVDRARELRRMLGGTGTGAF